MDGVVVRRVIPSDNSCLFNAVGYVMEHNRNKASELRQLPFSSPLCSKVIAATVAGDPEKFNEVFLGKPNEAYCAWILDPEKWGGAIELSILSEYYGREIAAYDIQTTRCDLYGQEKNYSERAMLIYDGLHYDALAMSPAEGAPEEFDQTIFPVNHDRSIGPAEGLALNLVREAQRKRSYTDTANFTLRCGVCQIGVIGQQARLLRLWNMRKPLATSTSKNTNDSTRSDCCAVNLTIIWFQLIFSSRWIWLALHCITV
ncbi:OTU-like cysteine protease family protein [Zea mays]|uniref:Ubiquitin thioesterase OTU n=1 Tax=Zea mays TaxID=4577 RepID=A0A1D6QSL7_MAIZE|nr:OTU-like cysteine protease family protein [Zea mays]